MSQDLKESAKRIQEQLKFALECKSAVVTIDTMDIVSLISAYMEDRKRVVELEDLLTKEREARWEYEKGMADAQLKTIDLARALKWYADEMNWNQGSWVDGAFVSRVGIDGGSLAQNALKLLEGNEQNEG